MSPNLIKELRFLSSKLLNTKTVKGIRWGILLQNSADELEICSKIFDLDYSAKEIEELYGVNL